MEAITVFFAFGLVGGRCGERVRTNGVRYGGVTVDVGINVVGVTLLVRCDVVVGEGSDVVIGVGGRDVIEPFFSVVRSDAMFGFG